MKQLIAVAVLVFATVFFSSCGKKDYTCRCKMSNGTVKEKWLGFMPNNQAQKACNDYQIELKNNPNGIMPRCQTTY